MQVKNSSFINQKSQDFNAIEANTQTPRVQKKQSPFHQNHQRLRREHRLPVHPSHKTPRQVELPLVPQHPHHHIPSFVALLDAIPSPFEDQDRRLPIRPQLPQRGAGEIPGWFEGMARSEEVQGLLLGF